MTPQSFDPQHTVISLLAPRVVHSWYYINMYYIYIYIQIYIYTTHCTVQVGTLQNHLFPVPLSDQQHTHTSILTPLTQYNQMHFQKLKSTDIFIFITQYSLYSNIKCAIPNLPFPSHTQHSHLTWKNPSRPYSIMHNHMYIKHCPTCHSFKLYY